MFLIPLDALHELILGAHGVVRILASDCSDGVALVVDREDLCWQMNANSIYDVLRDQVPHFGISRKHRTDPHGRSLLLFPYFPVDVLLDIGMVGVDDDHLRGAPRHTSAFDSSGSSITNFKKRHQTGRSSATR